MTFEDIIEHWLSIPDSVIKKSLLVEYYKRKRKIERKEIRNK